VHVIIPSAPGGAAEIIARFVTNKLGEPWGQQLVIESRPGAGVLVGTSAAAKARPDGYTLLFAYTAHVYGPTLYSNIPYDLIKDFDPIAEIGFTPQMIVVNPRVKATNVRVLIALLFGSAGIGSSLQLAGELFKNSAGVDMIHVPYHGSSPARVDLMGGRIDLLFPTNLSALPYVTDGRLRALAVTSLERLKSTPDIPTVAESGIPGFEASIWYGFLAPAGTPKDIISKINKDIAIALQAPEVRKGLEDLGMEIVTSMPEDFGKMLRSELEKWSKVIRAAGVKAN
jgi:tripartite-type tricarboxylate transporter receptor subunit TctC